jgi:hypothetical protein
MGARVKLKSSGSSKSSYGQLWGVGVGGLLDRKVLYAPVVAAVSGGIWGSGSNALVWVAAKKARGLPGVVVVGLDTDGSAEFDCWMGTTGVGVLEGPVGLRLGGVKILDGVPEGSVGPAWLLI